MNIFGSKTGHLSNRIIERFFFIFSKLFAVFDEFSKRRVPNVLLGTRKIIKYSENWGEDEENIAQSTVILMAAFVTKNVYSATATYHTNSHSKYAFVINVIWKRGITNL